MLRARSRPIQMLNVSQAFTANQKIPLARAFTLGPRCVKESADVTASSPSETHSSRTATYTWAGLTGVWIRLAAGMVSASLRDDCVPLRHSTHIGLNLGNSDASTLASGGTLKSEARSNRLMQSKHAQ